MRECQKNFRHSFDGPNGVRVACTVLLGLITQWIPTVDPCVLVKVGLLTPTVG